VRRFGSGVLARVEERAPLLEGIVAQGGGQLGEDRFG
jgi:hypothetical protein